MKRVLAVAPILLLAACASSQPDLYVASSSPVSVAVWGRNTTCLSCDQTAPVSDQQMAALATEHCAGYGKVARRIYEADDERGRTITFDCVAP